MAKDISGTWEGTTKLITTKTGWCVINTVTEPFGQFRTRMYKADSRGMVVDWDAIINDKKDLMDVLIKKYEFVPQTPVEFKQPKKSSYKTKKQKEDVDDQIKE